MTARSPWIRKRVWLSLHVLLYSGETITCQLSVLSGRHVVKTIGPFPLDKLPDWIRSLVL